MQITNEKKRKQSALVEQGLERCQLCDTPLVGADDPEQEQKLKAMEAIACGHVECPCGRAAA